MTRRLSSPCPNSRPSRVDVPWSYEAPLTYGSGVEDPALVSGSMSSPFLRAGSSAGSKTSLRQPYPGCVQGAMLHKKSRIQALLVIADALRELVLKNALSRWLFTESNRFRVNLITVAVLTADALVRTLTGKRRSRTAVHYDHISRSLFRSGVGSHSRPVQPDR
jgi:hypothetical protein